MVAVVDSGLVERQTRSFFSWRFITVMQAQQATRVGSPFTPQPNQNQRKKSNT